MSQTGEEKAVDALEGALFQVLFGSAGLNGNFTAVTCEFYNLEKVLNVWSEIRVENEWRSYEPISIAWSVFGRLLVLFKCVQRVPV